MYGKEYSQNKPVRTFLRVLLVGLFVAAIVSEIVYVTGPAKAILQSLKFAGLSYQQRQWLQEGPLVKTVDDMLDREYSESKGTCFVELPYSMLVKEGLGGKDPLLGDWGYLIDRTNYNFYPLQVDWGYSKNNSLYRISYGWEIVPESEPLSSIDRYPCVFLITEKDGTVTITKIKGNVYAP